jgi:hypothetical protein
MSADCMSLSCRLPADSAARSPASSRHAPSLPGSDARAGRLRAIGERKQIPAANSLARLLLKVDFIRGQSVHATLCRHRSHLLLRGDCRVAGRAAVAEAGPSVTTASTPTAAAAWPARPARTPKRRRQKRNLGATEGIAMRLSKLLRLICRRTGDGSNWNQSSGAGGADHFGPTGIRTSFRRSGPRVQGGL